MTVIRIKSDTTTNLTGTTPNDNEIVHDSSTNTLYVGDGATTFTSLSAVGGGGGGGSEVNNLQSIVTWADVPDANITQTSVVQHSGALEITESQVVDLGAYITSVSSDTTPTLGGTLTLDQNDFAIQVRNDSGSDIAAGTPVYINGYHAGSSKPLIAPADASSSSTMPALGLVSLTITNGSEGLVSIGGIVGGIDTTSPVSFGVGDTVYIKSGGGITNIRPTGVNDKIQNIGRVTKVNSSNGRILVLGAGRSNDVPNSGTFETLTVNDGIILPDSVPASTTNAVYNNGGTLYFNGSSLGGGGGGMTNLVDDTTPQLGGNLDAQSNEITAVSKLMIANTTTDDSFVIETTEDTSTAAPVICLQRYSSSPDDGDYLGQIKFKGENDASQDIVYAKITAKTSDVTDTTEDGLIEFSLKKAGSNNIGMRLTSTQLKLLNGTSLDMGSQPIENVTDPSSAQEAATKNYVDTVSSLSSLSITKSQVSDLNTLTSHRLVDGTYPFPSALDSSSNKALFSDGSSAVEFKTAPKSDTAGISGNVSGVYNIVVLDQTAYNNITTKDPNTIYFIP